MQLCVKQILFIYKFCGVFWSEGISLFEANEGNQERNFNLCIYVI